MHENSRNACREFASGLAIHRREPLTIADVGSLDVNGTYRDLFQREGWKYTGFDMRGGPNVDVVCEFGTGLLPEWTLGHFDVVISGQCMEHVAAPWLWIVDVVRLLNPGGLLWLAVPNTEVFHEHPIDCWRVWPDGLRAILAEGGLTEISCDVRGADTIAIARKA